MTVDFKMGDRKIVVRQMSTRDAIAPPMLFLLVESIDCHTETSMTIETTHSRPFPFIPIQSIIIQHKSCNDDDVSWNNDDLPNEHTPDSASNAVAATA